MQNIEYAQFLELIQPQPGFRVLDITSHADGLTQAVADKLSQFADTRLSLALYPGEHMSFEPSGLIKPHILPDYNVPFKARPRDNDIVMIRDVLDKHRHPERIVKAIYTTLGNAAEIIIVSKVGSVDVPEQLEMLERCEFRAGNSMDILDGYEIVTGKKMHMWGNGL